MLVSLTRAELTVTRNAQMLGKSPSMPETANTVIGQKGTVQGSPTPVSDAEALKNRQLPHQ